MSDASPDAARCQMPCQSLPCSCWAVTALSLTCSQHDAITSHPSLRAASPVPGKAEALRNGKTLGIKGQCRHNSNRQNRQFFKAFYLKAGNDYEKALKHCISKMLRDKINTVNIIQPFIVGERLREEEQYSLCCFDWHHCLSHSDRLPG